MLQPFHLLRLLLRGRALRPQPARLDGQRGQATAEYALVIVGAAALAGLLLAWAASTGRISQLLDAVLDSVIGQVG